MANLFGVPGVSVQELAEKRRRGAAFVLLDVREPHELVVANLGDGVTAVPLSQIARQQEAALPEELRINKDAEVLVLCHHGNRSAQVTGWLLQNGFTNVWNVDGGIDAYAIEVDTAVGRY